MSVEYRASTEADLPAIRALLQAAFDGDAGAPFLNPDLLRWKYFEANPAWAAVPRSYVLAQDGNLVAHGCAWPVELHSRSGPIQAMCLIDWASAKGIPGMGIMLARKMGGLAPVSLSIGGSEMTQKIMPRIGFLKRGELLTYARVLRPWRQFQTRPDGRGLRALLRFGRNLMWSLRPEELTHEWIAVAGTAQGFLAGCPGAHIAAYELKNGGQLQGSLLLSRVNGQSRIADLRVQDGSLDSAYAAAIQAARSDPDACELIALAQDGPTRRALLLNGFEERARRSVFVYDPGRRLQPEDFPLGLNMLADDLFYLNTPSFPYLT